MNYSNTYDRTAAGQYRRLKGKAKVRGISVTITLKQYIRLRKKPCTYCGSALPAVGHGIDRRNSKRGYHPGNCLPCCTNCNKAKSALSVKQFIAHITKIYTWSKNCST
jgi:hypothetical protein